MSIRHGLGLLALASALAGSSPALLSAQPAPGREAIDALRFEELSFRQPVPDRHRVSGVEVLLLEDHALPLVEFFARFRGGYGRFGREYYAAGLGLPALLRYGGTTTLSPDSVDETLEHYAVQTSFGGAGGSVSAALNTLSEHMEVAVGLWTDMLARPRFDEDQIEIWRGRQLESVLRRRDDPARLAFSTFNEVMYGDHPVGWELDAEDLAPERVAAARFRELHGRILCRDNLLLGVTGDTDWRSVRPVVERMVEEIPECPEALPEYPLPEIRSEPGILVVEKDLEQSVIVMAHPTDVRLDDDDEFYAATIGNTILGAGGFSSRILGRVRTEEGYAYSASSIWTTPRRHAGLVGAITRTSPENTVPAIDVILQTMRELTLEPPEADEVATAVDRIVNGFVFNFERASQIVSRALFFLAEDLPEDWLERYVDGVQRVTPSSVRSVFEEHLRPEAMTILVVGDPERIGLDRLAQFGAVTVLDSR